MYSMKAIFGDGGSSPLNTGIKLTYASMTVAIEAILSARLKSWKNIAKLMRPKNKLGKKIVIRVTFGCL